MIRPPVPNERAEPPVAPRGREDVPAVDRHELRAECRRHLARRLDTEDRIRLRRHDDRGDECHVDGDRLAVRLGVGGAEAAARVGLTLRSGDDTSKFRRFGYARR